MTNDHPMQPPDWLVELIAEQARDLYPDGEGDPIASDDARDEHIARAAYAAGADAELEACCDAIYVREGQPLCGGTAEWLRTTRRPKPPSLKQQALDELETLRGDANSMGMGFDAPAIRRALEQLPDD